MAAWRRAIELSLGDEDTAKLRSIARERSRPAGSNVCGYCWPIGKIRRFLQSAGRSEGPCPGQGSPPKPRIHRIPQASRRRLSGEDCDQGDRRPRPRRWDTKNQHRVRVRRTSLFPQHQDRPPDGAVDVAEVGCLVNTGRRMMFRRASTTVPSSGTRIAERITE
jgi:hypothetical protein